MKIYKVIDNAVQVTVTADRLVMLEALYKLVKKYQDKEDWFDVWEDEI